jgi:hypothetical protein
MDELSRRRFLQSLLIAGGLSSGGCGTILYPERRGQPAGRLDWGIVALDAVGLLLFFVPGVIAFAVDFSNGTIYLPPGQLYGQNRSDRSRKFVTVRVPNEQLSVMEVERVVSEHAKQDVQLVTGSYQTEKLATIDEFWPTADRFAAL